MSQSLSILRDDLFRFFKAGKDYDGTPAAANGRQRLRMAVFGSLPYGIIHDRFDQLLLSIPASWGVESMVDYAVAWVEAELARRPKAPKVY